MEIYLMDRGWVVVGSGRPDPSNPLFVTLTSAATVRRWGTTQGIGELAQKGPLSGTVLDLEPDGVRLNLLHCFRIIPCNTDTEAWKKWKRTG